MEEKQGSIVLKPATALIEELAGSVKVPKNLRGVDIDEAIRIAKKNYFGKRAK